MSGAPRVLVVQHEDGTGPGLVGDWLVEEGADLDLRHPYAGDDLPPTDAYDGLVVLGGAMGPAEDEAHPWLPRTRELMAEAVDRDVPVLGICLGAQLLAMACGGEVRRGRNGPELGVLPFALCDAAAEDPVASVLPQRPEVLQWHVEEIAALPPGATLLASTDAYRNQVFRVGSGWGVQGHPEVTPEIVAGWGRLEPEFLASVGRTSAGLVDEVAAAAGPLARTWRPVTQRFAGLVRSAADRRRAGPAEPVETTRPPASAGPA
jgi:GMP synthase-like glutamine amidotransferase